MRNIGDDNLQYLRLFTQYGQLLASEQSTGKPFQELLFIVRDWPSAFETPYGWNGQKLIQRILDENDQQTNDMRELRQGIKSSFEKIDAFLMPFPGEIVAFGNDFTGDVHQISNNFRKHVKELVTGLFSPENLIVKTINQQKVKARDLIEYLEEYLNIFNSDKLPPIDDVLTVGYSLQKKI